MARRSYSATAVPTSLLVGIGIADTSLVIADATGWPDGTGGSFIATIKRGQSGEEKILVTSRSGTTLSGLTRGYEGTAASTHASPETVEHTISKTDLDDANAHIFDTTRDDHTQYGLVKKTLLAARAALAHRSMQFHYGIDSGLLGVDDGTTWHDFQDKAASDALYLTPAAANAAYRAVGSFAAVRKVANQTVTSSTVYIDDTELKFAISASQTWVATFVLFVDGAQAADVKFKVTAPAGSTVSAAISGLDGAATANTASALQFAAAGTAAADVGAVGVLNTGGVATVPVTVHVSVLNSVTAGNVTLQWAQQASNATGTTVLAGSFLTATKVG